MKKPVIVIISALAIAAICVATMLMIRGSGFVTQVSAIEQYRDTVNRYYNKIDGATGFEKEKLCREAIRGFQKVIDISGDKRSLPTRQISAYYQARCYRMLGDTENYKRSLKICAGFSPDVNETDEDTIAYMRSLKQAAEMELREAAR